jgi:DNA invertase Pin-like site-specific DNA recombinase
MHKIAASKRKGLWVGGPLPLGYIMRDGKIAFVENEAERVRLIYRRYLELTGVNALIRDLKERNIRSKTRQATIRADYESLKMKNREHPAMSQVMDAFGHVHKMEDSV